MKSKPTLASIAALTLQRSQTEKPRCSAKIDQIRLRRAIFLPPFSQNASSSGRQSSIQVPPLAVTAAVAPLVLSVMVTGTPWWDCPSGRPRHP